MIVPTALDRYYLRQLTEIARRFYERGWAQGRAGNFSYRAKSGIIWQSPSDWNKWELTVDSFIGLDPETMRAVDPGAGRPSGEALIHAGIMHAMPTARSVVHGHSLAMVRVGERFAASGLAVSDQEMLKHLGAKLHNERVVIPVVPNPVTRDDMVAFSRNLGSMIMPQVPIVILRGHGGYAWGKDPAEALAHFEAAEHLCALFSA